MSRHATDIFQTDDPEYNCLRCQSVIPEALHEFYVSNKKKNSDPQLRLQSLLN